MQPRRASTLIAYGSLIAVGSADGLLGVAWPSMRDSFGLSLDAAGVFISAGTLGYIISSGMGGRLLASLGIGPLLVVSACIRAAGLVTIALAPTWTVVIASAFVYGLGGGSLETSLNTYVANNLSPRHMNWLHASYSVGLAVGALLVTALLVAGQVWRWGYAAVGGGQLVFGMVYLVTLTMWRGDTSREAGRKEPLALVRETFRMPLAWLGMALFFFGAGTEVATGQWAFTLFTEGRSVSLEVAGLWVGVYWGCLTASRFLIGFLANRVSLVTLLRFSLGALVAGAAVLWWNPFIEASFAALALMGLAVASVFPMLVSLTPARLGGRHAANAIGLQFAWGSIGVASLSGLGGVLAERAGIEAIGPFLLFSAVVLLALHELMASRTQAVEVASAAVGESGRG